MAAVSITPLLKQILDKKEVDAKSIAAAISCVFTNELEQGQVILLLTYLHIFGLEQRPDVLSACAEVMRSAAEPVNPAELIQVVHQRGHAHGNYHGGLCDIVGTGGDHHSTFNISTASSIVGSALLMIAKHGNRASTSRSGSADVLAALDSPIKPVLEAVTPTVLLQTYQKSNYAFLFAPNFHKGLRHVSALRKQIPHPTIFNLLGPLTNPATAAVEARVIGVKRKDLVPIFAESLRLSGANKAMVVCGEEDLDEISCAGPTHCAMLVSNDKPGAHGPGAIDILSFTLTPEDFGFPRHPLSTVSPGQTPEANAAILTRLLMGQMAPDDPILHFVLQNIASLFVVSGICNSTNSAFGDGQNVLEEEGPGKGRWKEGVRLARQAIDSGRALDMLQNFASVSSSMHMDA